MRKFNIKVDGVMHEVEVEELGGAVQSISPVQNNVSNAPVSVKATETAGSVKAPLQGTLQQVKVAVGDTVKEGDVVAVIEAMKMENDVPASKSGKVKNIYLAKGAKVSAGDIILDIA